MRVSGDLTKFIVDLKSTEKMFSVDLDQDFQDFRIFQGEFAFMFNA